MSSSSSAEPGGTSTKVEGYANEIVAMAMLEKKRVFRILEQVSASLPVVEFLLGEGHIEEAEFKRWLRSPVSTTHRG